MSTLIDLTGKKFGYWTVIKRDFKNRKNGVYWICKCDCGTIKSVCGEMLRNGASSSCGCKTKYLIGKANRKHGMAHTPLFAVWNSMKQRCSNPHNEKYSQYGGRGITVCKQWKHDFMNFYDWAMANGYKHGLSIDRIDVNKNYCPKNCRWATWKIQANNKTDNHKILCRGKLLTLSELSQASGIDYANLKYRIYNGWNIEKAVSLAPKLGRNQYERN